MSAVPQQIPPGERHCLHDWLFRQFCGATPSFPWAGTSVSVKSSVACSEMLDWWMAAQRVMHRLAGAYPALREWSKQLQMQSCGIEGIGPLVAGWAALRAALGVPDYPIQIQTSAEPGTVGMTLYSACPYEEFVRRGLQLTSFWLSLSHSTWRMGRLDLPKEELRRWVAAFSELGARLPSLPVLRLHYRLWAAGISWEWLGEDRTRVGEGSSQRTINGVDEDLALARHEHFRVPIYTVTGSVGKTTTARLLWGLLQGAGQRVALAASDGAWIGEQRVADGDCIGGATALALLRNPAVQAAVFEQGRGGLINQGVPYAHSDVAILLNVHEVHLGLDGVDTVEQMADVKFLGIRPAHLAVLNHDDMQCRRVGAQRNPSSCVWFSTKATPDVLNMLGISAHAAVGAERNSLSEPIALTIWQAGKLRHRMGLNGVAPYHGMLGEKTLEELLAAIAAAWFGPLALNDWPERLRGLRLDQRNHAFRTSLHRQGPVTFVLDKAGEAASLQLLQQAVEHLTRKEGYCHRIAVLARSAGEHPDRHRESAQHLHRFMDEFICFDRPESYAFPSALPVYRPGSLPKLLHEEFERLNAETGTSKPVTIAANWESAESVLRERLSAPQGKVLVLINQPSTSSVELNRRILAFATSGLSSSPRGDTLA